MVLRTVVVFSLLLLSTARIAAQGNVETVPRDLMAVLLRGPGIPPGEGFDLRVGGPPADFPSDGLPQGTEVGVTAASRNALLVRGRTHSRAGGARRGTSVHVRERLRDGPPAVVGAPREEAERRGGREALREADAFSGATEDGITTAGADFAVVRFHITTAVGEAVTAFIAILALSGTDELDASIRVVRNTVDRPFMSPPAAGVGIGVVR